MNLILWRHADAQATGPDLARALTAKGNSQAKQMAKWLNHHLPEHCKILCSPATRAVQTVEQLNRKFDIYPELAPGSSIEDIVRLIGWPNVRDTMLLVGHQPVLGQLTALLISGSVQEWEIRKAAIWWIAQRDEGVYVKAVISPELREE